MDAYVIIGDANSFKSSTVRSLTGCRVRGVREILHPGGGVVETFVQISSLQEGNNPITSNAFIQEVGQSGAKAVIFPLRALMHRGRADANSYIQDFINSGWQVIRVAVLHSPGFTLTVPLSPGVVDSYPAGLTPRYYANELASQVRQNFGWV